MSRQIAGYGVHVKGIRELQRNLRHLEEKELLKELRSEFKAIAALVAESAKQDPETPVMTGRLKKSIGAIASTTSASVKAGTDSRVAYAGPIHWGWEKRNIKANPFLMRAVKRNQDEIERIAEAGINRIKMKHRLGKRLGGLI